MKVTKMTEHKTDKTELNTQPIEHNVATVFYSDHPKVHYRWHNTFGSRCIFVVRQYSKRLETEHEV